MVIARNWRGGKSNELLLFKIKRGLEEGDNNGYTTVCL